MGTLTVMVRRQLRANRTLLIVMTALITINNIVQVTAYQSVFPDPRTRAAMLASFTSNGALRAFYGYPYDIANATGWLAWRSLGFIAVVTAIWGAFITVGALRGEEDAGRAELTLSGPQSRLLWFSAAFVAVVLETTAMGAVDVVGLTAFCVTQGLMTIIGTLEISLQLMLPALLFAAVGAVTSQLVGTTRGARIAATAVVALALMIRTAADMGSGIGWLRWVGPLGWIEELHPPAAPSPVALFLIGATWILLAGVSVRLLATRDIGVGLLPHSDSRAARRFLLGAPWQAALRDEIPQLSMWLAGSVVYTLLLGSLTKTLLDLVKSNSAFSDLFTRRFDLNSFVAASFSIVQIIATILAVTMVVGARGEEASGRLELLVARPVSRIGWLVSRATLGAAVAFILTIVSAVALWSGAAVVGQNVSFGSVVEAALNCIPLIVLSTGTAVVVMAIVPRAVAFVYAPIAIAYLWDALGTAIKAPSWSLDLSPFHVLAAVPAQNFEMLPALTLTAIGLVFMAVGVSVFRGRDLATA